MSTDTVNAERPKPTRAKQPIMKALARHIAGYVGSGANAEGVAVAFLLAGFEELRKHHDPTSVVALAQRIIELHAKGGLI